jgi:hypothetical protein
MIVLWLGPESRGDIPVILIGHLSSLHILSLVVAVDVLLLHDAQFTTLASFNSLF